MKVVVLNDGETYTDIDGCFVLDGTNGEIDAVMEEGREYEYDLIGEISLPLYRINKIRS